MLGSSQIPLSGRASAGAGRPTGFRRPARLTVISRAPEWTTALRFVWLTNTIGPAPEWMQYINHTDFYIHANDPLWDAARSATALSNATAKQQNQPRSIGNGGILGIARKWLAAIRSLCEA